MFENEMLIFYALIGFSVILLATVGFVIHELITFRVDMNKTIDKRLMSHENFSCDMIHNEIARVDGKLIFVDNSLKKLKESVEMMQSCLEDYHRITNIRLSNIEKNADHDTLVKAVNRLIEVVDNLCDRESEDWVGSVSEGVYGPSGGIPACDIQRGPSECSSVAVDGADHDGDEMIDKCTDEIAIPTIRNWKEYVSSSVSYRWIFPDRDPVEELIYGQWYLVIGESSEKLKSDGKPMIYCDEGFWNGSEFVTATDVHFNKVYAYIKPPTSADVMEQVVNIALGKVC